jgi:hypothetical protein
MSRVEPTASETESNNNNNVVVVESNTNSRKSSGKSRISGGSGSGIGLEYGVLDNPNPAPTPPPMPILTHFPAKPNSRNGSRPDSGEMTEKRRVSIITSNGIGSPAMSKYSTNLSIITSTANDKILPGVYK